MSDLHIELWPLERLHSYGRQLKDRNTALPKMVEALRTWGFRVPLLVTADGEVVDGEVRLEAARELGEKLGRPCRIVNGKKKGRIELEYYGTEDLNALLEALEKLGKR